MIPASGSDLISSLESYLKLSSTREQMIATNMANVDTPGYRTRDIDFDRELKRAINQAGFTGGAAELTPAVQEVKGLLERPDGNNVDLDREGLMLAQTQLQHEMGVQLLKSQFHTLLSAISGGGNS